MRLRARARVAIWLLLLPVLAGILFPFGVMLSTSLKPADEVAALRYQWLPAHPRPANYADVFHALPLARYFANSVIVALGATALGIACAVPAAYALARLRFAGKGAVRFAILVTQMFSPIVLIVALFSQFGRYGLLAGANVYVALILANAAFSLAFGIWLLSGYFATVPLEIEEAALMDGCSRLGTVRRVMLPLAAPGIVTTVIFTFIAAWNEFMFALTFVADDRYKPLTVGIFSFVGQYAVDWQYLMAAALLATVPVIALFLAVEGHLIRGLTTGAIK